MSYNIDFGAWSGIFAVPNCIVDEHLRLAGAAQLKALLYCLRNSQSSITDDMLSAALGLSKADAADAVQYWIQSGILKSGSEAPKNVIAVTAKPKVQRTVISEADTRDSKAQTAADTEIKTAEISTERTKHISAPNIKPNSMEVNRRATEDTQVAFLLQEAQLRLSRMISPSESSTLVYLHDYFGLPSEVILMIMEYAARHERCNMRYIEKVAIQWSDEGIDSLEKAEKKINAIEIIESNWYRLLTMIGLDKRTATPNEMKYLTRWLDEWKFSLEAVRLAYFECADNTHKVIFRYINKVLESWHNAGAHTVEEIEKLKTSAAQKQSGKGGRSKKSKEASFDLDEYEKLTNVNPTL